MRLCGSEHVLTEWANGQNHVVEELFLSLVSIKPKRASVELELTRGLKAVAMALETRNDLVANERGNELDERVTFVREKHGTATENGLVRLVPVM